MNSLGAEGEGSCYHRAVAGSLAQCLQPLDVGPLRLRNRFMMTTHGPRLPAARYVPYLEERSRQVALVGIHAGYGMGSFPPGPGRFRAGDGDGDPDAVAPHPLTDEGRAWCERFVPLLAEQAAAVHRGGAACVGQLHHAGASDAGDTLRALPSPSGIPDEARRRSPHVLTATEIADLVEVFASAAGRVVRAGCDAVEIHGAHGYLLNQFLSPLTNHRTDCYGGSAENRRRLLLEVLAAVQEAVDGAVPVGVRIPGRELAAGGLTVEDMSEVARRLAAGGAAYLSVSNGTYTGLRGGLGLAYVAPGTVGPGPSVADAAAVRAAAGIPVVVAGRIIDPAQAEAIVAGGQADVVGLTRALIADPRFVEKARRGASDTIDRCIACNECHTGLPVRCTVNPAAGREVELALRPAATARHVVVVGGGPAGMQCARVAAARGHRVTLLEEEDVLGGALAALAADPARPELAHFLAHLRDGVRRQGVDVRLGLRASPATLAELAPDVVVLATGAREVLPELPGIDLPQVTTALPVLAGAVAPSGRVAVVGGLDDHVAPLVVADRLARSGCQVSLMTELVAPGEGVEPATRLALLQRLHHQAVAVHPLLALAEVRPGAVVGRDVLTSLAGPPLAADAVVVVGRRRASDALAADLATGSAPTAVPVELVGDCLAPRRLIHATTDATRQAVVL